MLILFVSNCLYRRCHSAASKTYNSTLKIVIVARFFCEYNFYFAEVTVFREIRYNGYDLHVVKSGEHVVDLKIEAFCR